MTISSAALTFFLEATGAPGPGESIVMEFNADTIDEANEAGLCSLAKEITFLDMKSMR